ncbi:MAG: hypothetical protein AAGF11_11070 [Myxococcota bacterium]
MSPPSGGLARWAHARDLDVDRWATAARERGVRIRSAREFAFDGRRRPFVRMGFARHTESELATAIERLVDATRGCTR